MARIIFTVINDLSYDQRMQRIAGSMADAGHQVLLVGRKLPRSVPLTTAWYRQKRLSCFFMTGFALYAEYNFRLFWFLLFTGSDILCAIDLDTILPVYFVSLLKRTKRVYDAHELFTEQKEIVSRPSVQKAWLAIEKFAVPRFPNGYTVNGFIAGEFRQRYKANYAVVRNLPIFFPLGAIQTTCEKWIIYQGSVNEGRCFETLIPAMKQVQARLVICGEGNFFEQVKQLIDENGLHQKIELKGYVSPTALKELTQTAYVGITLFEPTGLNQYQSLANRFFDYMMAGIPQVCVNYPEYAALNKEHGVALMLNDTSANTIASALNNLLTNDVLHGELTAHCRIARQQLNWDNEKAVLLNFYKDL